MSLGQASPLADQSLRQAKIRERFAVTVVALTRSDGAAINPTPDTVLRAGDTVRVFGLPAHLEEFRQEARRDGGGAGQE